MRARRKRAALDPRSSSATSSRHGPSVGEGEAGGQITRLLRARRSDRLIHRHPPDSPPPSPFTQYLLQGNTDCNTILSRVWTSSWGDPDHGGALDDSAVWTAVDNPERRPCLKRIDTHTHPKISKHFSFDPRSVHRMVRMAKRVGLDGVALTEHFHGRDFWAIYEDLEPMYPRRGAVLGGRAGPDSGGRGQYPGRRARDRARRGGRAAPARPGLPRAAVGGLRARPPRIPRRERRLRRRADRRSHVPAGEGAGKFSAAELGACTRSRSTARTSARRSCCWFRPARSDLPIVAGSDAHHWLQLGVRHSLVHTDEIGVAAVIKAIKEGLTGYGVGAYTPVRVRASKSVKNITKLLRKSRGLPGPGSGSWGTWPRSQALEKPLAG